MKPITAICTGLTLVVSIIAVNLWLDLRKERELNATRQGRPSEVRSLVGNPPVASPNPTKEPTVAVGASETPIGKTELSTHAPTMTTALAALQSSANRQKEMLKDPEYRKIFLAQMRSTIERTSPGLAAELGLSETEADKFFNLLAEHQLARTAEGSLLSRLGDQSSDPDALQRSQTLNREQEEAIRAQLGGRYAQWQAYQQTLPARTRVTSMGAQLAQLGKPLTQSQSNALTTAMIAEQQRQTQEARVTSSALPGNPADRAQLNQSSAQTVKRLEENNRRTLDAVAPYINADQLAALRRQMEQQAVMTRVTGAQIEREQTQPAP